MLKKIHIVFLAVFLLPPVTRNIFAQGNASSATVILDAAVDSKMQTGAETFYKAMMRNGNISNSNVYVYDEVVQRYNQAGGAKKLAARLILLGFTDIYLDARPSDYMKDYSEISNKTWIQEFISYLHAYTGYTIRVHALMFSVPEQYNKNIIPDLGITGHQLIRRQATVIAQYNKDVELNKRFDGAAADWEPHTLSAGSAAAASAGLGADEYWIHDNQCPDNLDCWKTDPNRGGFTKEGPNDKLLERTGQMLAYAKHCLDSLNVKGSTSAALPLAEAGFFHVQEQYDAGNLNYGDILNYLNNGCADVNVMAYFFKKEEVWRRTKVMLDAAKNRSKNKSVYATIKTRTGDDEDDITSLKLQGWSYLISAINYINDQAISDGLAPFLKGICIYEYNGFEQMWATQQDPPKYDEKDKEGIRQIVSRNLSQFNMSASDTANWRTSEDWIDTKLNTMNTPSFSWNQDTPFPMPLDTVNISGKGLNGSIDFNYFPKAYYIDCSNNNLNEIHVDNIAYLARLDCSSNKLTELDLSKTQIEVLYCQNNLLRYIKNPYNMVYSSIRCQNNNLLFSTLPLVDPSSITYEYSPQATIDGGILRPGKIAGIGSEYKIDTHTTSYIWNQNIFKNLGNGRYMFGPDDAGKTFTARLKNAYFPKLTLDYTVKIMPREEQYNIYNEGLMTIKDTQIADTRLYIGGHLTTATRRDNTGTSSKIYTKASKTILTGDFYNDVRIDTVFYKTDIPNDSSIFEFRWFGNSQNITTHKQKFDSIPSKKTNYIAFPANLKINNYKHVFIDPSLALKANNISLDTGRLVLKARLADARDFQGDSIIDGTNRSVLSHLLVTGRIDYNNWADTIPYRRGSIQVDLALDHDSLDLNSDYGQNYRSLVGFGIPFNSLKADYFMFNFLMAPTHSSFLGTDRTTIINPTTALTAGRGYGLGIDLRGTNQNDYADIGKWVPLSNFQNRTTDYYTFNRNEFEENSSIRPNQLFGKNAIGNSAYEMEKLNIKDVNIKLGAKGFYYLSNPFMTPLDVSNILDGTYTTDWKAPVGSLEEQVWILTGDSKAVAKYQGNRIKVVHKYDVLKNPGGTYDEDKDLIAPLQMFVVKTKTDNVNLTIPANKRTMGHTKFIRSQGSRYDDFIFEVKDEKTGMSDRTNIVLRPADDIASHRKNWNNVKKVRAANSNESKEKSDMIEGQLSPTIFSQLYTASEDNQALIVNFLPLETTNKVPLYMTPSEKGQQISIRGIRLNSMYHVSVIWLEDKLEKKVVKLTLGTVYTTFSSPSDRVDRFNLYFKDIDPKKIKEVEDIWANYQSGTLKVSGFEDKDFGAVLQLFDMTGRKYMQTKVNNYTMNIPCVLNTGVYIVKISGNRNSAVKVLVNE